VALPQGAGPSPWGITSGGLPPLEVHVGITLPDPLVSDGVYARLPGVRIRCLSTPQSFLQPFLALRVPPPPPAATMTWPGILAAVHLTPIVIPEREAAVHAETIGIGRNKRLGLCSSHYLIQPQ